MYYTTIIKTDSQVITKYDTYEGAMESFHTEMAYAYNQRLNITAYVTNVYGAFLQKPVHYAPAVEEVEE